MSKERLNTDDEHLIKYLLGELRDEGENRLEEEYFNNYALVEQIRAVEDDLIEDYVQRRLSRRRRRRFEEYYLTTDERRQKVRYAEEFVEALRRPAAIAVSTTEVAEKPWWKEFFGWIGGNRLVTTLAVAVLILAVAIGALFINAARLSGRLAETSRERARLEAETADLRNQGQQLEQQLAAQTGERQQLNNQLAQLRQDLDAIQSRLADMNRRDAGARSFLLTTELIRSGQPAQILSVDSETKVVRLRIRLKDDEYRGYAAEVRTVGGEKILGADLKVRRRPSSVYLSTTVPLSKLAGSDRRLLEKDLVLTVNGKNGAETTKLAEYLFKVVER